MKHPIVLSTSAWLLATSLSLLGAADVATIRVELNGKTYVGQLTAESAVGSGVPSSTSQPATQAADSSAPAGALSGPAPFQVHLDANEVVAPEALRDSHVSWNFGDADGRYNALDGFNAAHVYDKAGTYTITRTIKTADGVATRSWAVDVKPAARRTTYVSLDGDDRNDGRTPEHAVRTFDRGVLGTNGGNGEVLFRRGDKFPVTRALQLRYDDCLLGAYGDASKPRPVLFNIGTINSPTMIDSAGKRLVVEDLAFDAPKAKPFDKPGTLDVITAHGEGLVVRRCTALNINDLVNGNGHPVGVMIVDSEAPTETGLRSYFAWVQGTDWTIVGNTVANSTREHVVRVGGGERINIQFNRFSNLDRRKATTQPDAIDTAKAALNIQKGAVLYVAHNVLIGPSGVGPLGKTDGLKEKDARWVGAIVEHNWIDGPLEVKHGASHVSYRDNLVRVDDSVAFPIDGFSSEYGRGVVDFRLERNTAINAGKSGNFASVWGGAKELSFIGNVYVAPNLAIGRDEASVVCVLEPDLRAFTTISGNVWPIAKPVMYAHNGVNYVHDKPGDTKGYVEPAAWLKLPQVKDDRFETIALNDWANVKNAGATAADLPTTQPTTTETTR